MLSKLKNIIKNVKLNEKNINETAENIKIKKDAFDKEWNTWGIKKSNTKKIP